MKQAQQDVVLALGSNLGNRMRMLRLAITHLRRWLTDIAESPVYATAPRYVEEQPQFLNMAVRASAELSPTELLAVIQQVELDLGRVRLERYGPRTIDIDIIYYGDGRVQLPHLTIPHPLRAERQFVLAPVADLVPERVDPATGQTVRAMLHALPASDDDCVPLGPLPEG